jgi:hypothetical protein
MDDPTSVAELAYEETRQQLADQAAELERTDRKATALLTPLGLLIGLAINARTNLKATSSVDFILYVALGLLVLAILSGVLALWPRNFQRLTPGSRSSRDAIAPAWPPGLTWSRRVIAALSSRVLERATTTQAALEKQHLYPPTWRRATKRETLERLTGQLAAAWRINASLLPGKVVWLHRQYLVMFLGSLALAAWYVVRNTVM